jgi:hypothetical protein
MKPTVQKLHILKKKWISIIFLEETGVIVINFDSVSGSNENILYSNCDDFDSKSNVLTFAICLFFIAQIVDNS